MNLHGLILKLNAGSHQTNPLSVVESSHSQALMIPWKRLVALAVQNQHNIHYSNIAITIKQLQEVLNDLTKKH